MTTITEISPPEIMPSSSVQMDLLQKAAKAARRRRLEIKKLTSICKAETTTNQNGVVKRQQQRNPSSEEGERERVTCESHGAASVMGRRREMEDSVSVELGLLVEMEEDSRSYDFFGVFDGHGGSHVAEACSDRMHSILREELKNSDTCRTKIDWEMVMMRSFERMDREVGGGKEDVEEMTVGSTAVTAVVGKEEVVVANCGDSRAVICRSGVAVPLSIDHKPDRPDELARIEAAGGRVINWNGYRVLGVLATSRSIGDHYLRPYVSPTPEVTISKRTEEDEFLILASDGLWDVISNEVACQIVRRCLTGRIHRKTEEPTNGTNGKCSRAEIAASLLTELAIAKGSKDNVSVIVVELRKFSSFVCS